MASFFLYNKNGNLDKNEVIKYYSEKNLNNYSEFDLGNYRLILFRKTLIPIKNYFFDEEYEIYATGTLFYKMKNYPDSLELLLKDYIINKIDANELFGNYLLIFHNRKKNKTEIVFDPAFIKSVYYTGEIMSSDLMAIYKSNISKYSVNQLAVIENIVSGCLIPPDTCFKEISRIVKYQLDELASKFIDITFTVFYPDVINRIYSKSDAIDHAANNLNRYFESVKSLSAEFGAHLGLTGGFDSRLLLINAKKHIRKLEVNSFWRDDSLEFNNAKILAETAGYDLFYFKDYTDNSLMDKAFYNFGGVIRSQNYWSEIFNSLGYCSRVANSKFLGFHGSGGEQYRNHERIWRTYDFDAYIKYNWLYKQCKKSIIDEVIESKVLDRVKEKIINITHINKTRIGVKEIKKIQNEVWNISNRTTRIDLLNQWMFYLAPFTEYQISYSAYQYIPYLGKRVEFQKELIKSMNVELAKVRSNYGNSFCDKDPLIPEASKLFLSWLSPKLQNYLYHNYIKSKNYNLENKRDKKSNLTFLKNKIDISLLESNFVTKNMLESYEYLLKKLG